MRERPHLLRKNGRTMPLIVVTGPVRSGKSRFAQTIARRSGLFVRYIATAAHDSQDVEWSARIERHVMQRPREWETVETEALEDASMCAMFTEARADACLLVDALGTWLALQIGLERDAIEGSYAAVQARLDGRISNLVDAMIASRALVVVVCEQVGWDVVPVAPSGRLFRDVIGRAGQRLASSAQNVYFVVAGIALDLRQVGEPVTDSE